MKTTLSSIALLGLATALPSHAAVTSHFDDLSLAPNSFWAGETNPAVPLYTPNPSSFSSGLANFSNQLTDWGGVTSWTGWAYSNMTDVITQGYENQYSAYTGQAHSGSNFALAYVSGDGAPISFGQSVQANGFYLTNTSYVALTLLNGDGFSKKFGGNSGNDADWLKLTVTGLNNGVESANIDFYLADYRSTDNGLDYIVNSWEWLDLSGLGVVDGMKFALSSSDTGLFGMNTPAYFAIDDLTVTAVPLPGAVWFMSAGLLAVGRFNIRKLGRHKA